MNPATTDSRMLFEGNFAGAAIDSVPKGAAAPQSDANFLSRRDAMANAYHFATQMIPYAKETAATAKHDASVLSGNWETLRALPEANYNAGFNASNMERLAVTLSGMFSFDNTTVTAAAYQGKFEGFSLTHGTLGKIMDVSAKGEITLYGSDGTAYSAAEYNAANVDGGIPQLHNDMIRKADEDERLSKLQARINASRQASSPASAPA